MKFSAIALNNLLKLISCLLIIPCFHFSSFAQNTDIPSKERNVSQRNDKINLLLYTRTIMDPSGNVRYDQNIVPNIKLNKWLRLELGFRQGERPQHFASYNHYKVELQTKYFSKRVRFLVRLSDNIIQYPSPVFSKSNYLFIAEGKQSISPAFQLFLSYGYVFSYQRDAILDAWPSTSGTTTTNSTYKLALRYSINDKGFAELVYGAYDVFNAYLLSTPFTQVSFDHELSDRLSFYSYFRYQFNNKFDIPQNNFLGLGVRLFFLKKAN